MGERRDERLKRGNIRYDAGIHNLTDIEHRGIYDQEFLDYTVKALLKAKEYGFKVMIDFHQDVVSTQDPSFLHPCLRYQEH